MTDHQFAKSFCVVLYSLFFSLIHLILLLNHRCAKNTFYTQLKHKHRQICLLVCVHHFVHLPLLFSVLCRPRRRKKQLSFKRPYEKSKTKNKLQLVCVRQFEFPGVSPRSVGTLFLLLFLRLHGLLHQLTLMAKQATESPAEFRFTPLHTVQTKDAFLGVCRLFFLVPSETLIVCLLIPV